MAQKKKVKTNKPKTEEEIRAEVKAELEEEAEMKEEAKKKAEREIEKRALEDEEQEYESKRRKRKVNRFIYNLIVWAIVLFVLFETVMGVLDMQRLNEDKAPLWYISAKENTEADKKTTRYNIGLYYIEKVQDGKETKIILKPFFIK